MNRLLGTVVTTMACFVMSTSAWAAINIQVTPAFGPSGLSPNFGSYASNAISALQTGSPGSARTAPDVYEATGPGPISPVELISTPFNSWRGVAGPSAPFDNELGNAIYFGARIYGDAGETFSLQDVFFEVDSNDPQDTFDFPITALSGNYRATLWGIDYGGNGVLGGGDDTVLNSGEAGSTAVNEILYVGVASAYDASGFPGATDQDKIDALLSDTCLCETTLLTKYAVIQNGNTVGQGEEGVRILPEPSSLMLALLPMLGLIGSVRRRK